MKRTWWINYAVAGLVIVGILLNRNRTEYFIVNSATPVPVRVFVDGRVIAELKERDMVYRPWLSFGSKNPDFRFEMLVPDGVTTISGSTQALPRARVWSPRTVGVGFGTAGPRMALVYVDLRGGGPGVLKVGQYEYAFKPDPKVFPHGVISFPFPMPETKTGASVLLNGKEIDEWPIYEGTDPHRMSPFLIDANGGRCYEYQSQAYGKQWMSQVYKPQNRTTVFGGKQLYVLPDGIGRFFEPVPEKVEVTNASMPFGVTALIDKPCTEVMKFLSSTE